MGPETAVLPLGWQDRLVSIKNENTKGVTGLCLEVHDLAISKLVAGRLKDLEFVQELIRNQMLQRETMIERLASTELAEKERSRITTRTESLFDVDDGRGEKILF